MEREVASQAAEGGTSSHIGLVGDAEAGGPGAGRRGLVRFPAVSESCHLRLLLLGSGQAHKQGKRGPF